MKAERNGPFRAEPMRPSGDYLNVICLNTC